MMDGMLMNCPGCSGWMMTGMMAFWIAIGVLLLVVLVLAAAALIKYLRS
jgi:hypothetical protein